MKTITKAGLKTRANVKAGGFGTNHNRAGIKVRVPIKAGGFGTNHNQSGISVKSGIKAGGGMKSNHSVRLVCIR